MMRDSVTPSARIRATVPTAIAWTLTLAVGAGAQGIGGPRAGGGPGRVAAPPSQARVGAPAPRTLPGVVGDKTVAEIRIVGNRIYPTDRILSKLSLAPGRPYTQSQLMDNVRTLYRTHWFYHVDPKEQDVQGGTVVTFEVLEQPIVQQVRFLGNTVYDEADLLEMTGLRPGKSMDPALNTMMARLVQDKYREGGYPFATVELAEGGKAGDLRVVMRIDEGPKTKVLGVAFEGNEFVGDRRLGTQIQTGAALLRTIGGAYDAETIDQDVAALTNYYRTYGFLDVRVEKSLDWKPDRSGVYVTFRIAEGQRFTVRSVRYEGSEAVARDRFESDLKLAQHEPFNQDDLKHDVQKIQDAYGGAGYIFTQVQPDVRYAEQPGVVDVVYQVGADTPRRVGDVRVVGNEITKGNVIREFLNREGVAPGEVADTTSIRRAQARLVESRLFNVDPSQGAFPTVRFDPNGDPNSEFQDVLVDVQEGQTGSLLLGLGVNSNSGLGGSLVLNERNFDLFRVPTSFEDLLSGRAFRGAGQELRLEAVPGTQVHRYSATLSDPTLLGTAYRGSANGYYFRRRYQPYDEERLGGRFTVGRRFTRTLSGAVTARVENIEISDIDPLAPPDLVDVLGDNFLTSLRVAAIYDARDSNLNPTEGHRVEAGYEQAFGDFDYPRFTVEGSKFWTVFQRNDGSGKHILRTRAEFGYSGSDTPIFERFYAGGFNSIRGFQFRGVGPVQNNIEVGGDFQLITSAEYYLPLDAQDNLGMVFFVDGGTVESDFEVNDYRVAAGFGFRVKVPQMGPVPLAFDFGFPVNDIDTDDRQVFGFYLGLFR